MAEQLKDSPESDQTKEYSLNGEEENQATVDYKAHYTDADFGSVDGSEGSGDVDDEDKEEAQEDTSAASNQTRPSRISISDNSSDDNMEKPWKEVKPQQKKYRQTTLSVSSSAASSSRVEATAGPVTRKTVSKRKSESERHAKLPRYSDRDTENYRLGYPGQKDDPRLNANLQFYKGQISSSPDGAFIDDIHNDWWGNFELLERHHGYIQWIFPIREEGMNWQAHALQLHEAKAIVADRDAHNRVLLSYEMMLDFYGMKLIDRRTGELQRSKRWKECYQNLSYSSHNYLRITRILKSLGEFELEHLKKPFLQFLVGEIFEEGQLRRTRNSLQNYWVGTLKDDADRAELHAYIEENS